MGNTVSSPSGQSQIYDCQTYPRSGKKSVLPKANTIERSDNRNQNNGNQENSRMLFLMYLINRTWNVVVDGKGSKRWVYQRLKCIALAYFCALVACDSLQKVKLKARKCPKTTNDFVWHHFHFHLNLNSNHLHSLCLLPILMLHFIIWFSPGFFLCSLWNIFQRWWNQQNEILECGSSWTWRQSVVSRLGMFLL